MRRRSPACDVLGPKARVKDYELVQKDQGLGRVLTESLGRPELYRGRDHDEDGGAAEMERGVREVLGSSGVLGCTGRRAMPLRSKTWGSNRANSHRRRVIAAAAELTCVGSRPNYGEDTAQIGAKGFRVMPGLGAGPWRGLAGVVARQGGVAATAWRSGAGRSWWRRLLGFTATRGVE